VLSINQLTKDKQTADRAKRKKMQKKSLFRQRFGMFLHLYYKRRRQPQKKTGNTCEAVSEGESNRLIFK